MIFIKKPKAITITIRDRARNKGKNLTVYGTTIEEVIERIKKALDDG